MPTAAELIILFNEIFRDQDTVLVGGGSEPLYEPATADGPARLTFRADYPASAQHEIAHWCIAGKRRRRLVDFGYWYEPDGRDAERQAVFEQVEARPQALEWAFHVAAGTIFHCSADNLDAGVADLAGFERAVVEAAGRYARDGYPLRAQRWMTALADRFAGHGRLQAATWTLAEMGQARGPGSNP